MSVYHEGEEKARETSYTEIMGKFYWRER